MLRLKFSGLQLDDEIAQLLDVEEKQIDIEVVTIHIKVDLPAHEGKSWSKFPKRFGDSVHERLLQVSLSNFSAEPQEFKGIGIFCHLLGQFRVTWGERPYGI